MREQQPNDFERQASSAPGGGLLGDLWLFVRHNRKWWLIPLLAVMFLLALLMTLSGTAAAPFIYTLF
jgi:hypothetical protein